MPQSLCRRELCGSSLEAKRSNATAQLLQPCPHPRLAGVLRAGLGLLRRSARFQRLLDSRQFHRPGLGQAPGLLLLLTGWWQARQWRRWLDRRAVGQPGDGLTQRKLGIQPCCAPALGVALRLSDVGSAYLLLLPELLALHPQTDTRAASVMSDGGRLAAVVPKRPALTRLAPQPEGTGAVRKPW